MYTKFYYKWSWQRLYVLFDEYASFFFLDSFFFYNQVPYYYYLLEGGCRLQQQQQQLSHLSQVFGVGYMNVKENYAGSVWIEAGSAFYYLLEGGCRLKNQKTRAVSLQKKKLVQLCC